MGTVFRKENRAHFYFRGEAGVKEISLAVKTNEHL